MPTTQCTARTVLKYSIPRTLPMQLQTATQRHAFRIKHMDLDVGGYRIKKCTSTKQQQQSDTKTAAVEVAQYHRQHPLGTAPGHGFLDY